ncbi:MAG TPA: nicotinate phosphoribosyltransferase [Vicinamibacterales bacterium]|jgi:nicotinate phosphoribosyltransferase
MANTPPHELALFTDLYELTMMQGYLAEHMTDRATFTLFVRRLPQHRNFLLACGLEQVLAYLEELHFTEDDVAYLRSLNRFSDEFFASLRAFRFTGDVYAVPEGTPVFANEPIVEVVAPIAQGQLVETFVMNQIHVQTVLASKAVRVVTAARGRQVVDFGARRTHGVDAALQGARAFYIAGVSATSNVLAGKVYRIPVAGTMAHSFIQAHGDEREAFRAFVRAFPGTTLLVDTYDTLEGVRRVIDLVKSAPDEMKVTAIRLDSGDLAALAREARRLLDEAGLHRVEIFASSGLDEHEIDSLLAADAPIDGFGVGTGMSVSVDAPSLDIAYKLAEYGGQGRTKLSREKPILPGRKQVFRQHIDGKAAGDVIARADESLEGRSLLQVVMRAGRRTSAAETNLEEIRRYTAAELARLPERVIALAPADPAYPVRLSPALERYHANIRATAAAQ